MIYCSRLILLTFFIYSCNTDNASVSAVKKISYYPSASGIEYFEHKYYVIGDDARSLLILDEQLNPVDSLMLYPGGGKRIPKDSKADLESIALLKNKTDTLLCLFGSGSLAPHRNTFWVINPKTGDKTSAPTDTFYTKLSEVGLKEINIEGACYVPGFLVLANRGHKGNPKNHLVLVKQDFANATGRKDFHLIKVGSNSDTAAFNGVSGLAYAPQSDKLILSVSTEDTRSVYEDGAIGKSYLWIIDNVSSKRQWTAINPNRIIDLEEVDKRFKGQKIESVCITNETADELHLALAADNDDGGSSLFKIVMEK